MNAIKESRFFEQLLARYVRSPSIVLCRVPELELFSKLKLEHPVLDHCCGDGFFADIAFPGIIINAGVDISRKQLNNALKRGNYQRLDWADAGDSLPFLDGEFATVINNSGIEHIPDLNMAIAEIARVLKVGGKVYLNVLNSRFFDRWPLNPETAESYKNFQPFYHALDENSWRSVLQQNQFTDITFTDYLPEVTSKLLAKLDYRYSSFCFHKTFSPVIFLERFLPKSYLIKKWREILSNLKWQAIAGTGSGFLISATKNK